jgi:putative nucleotidyltransferase with HDIG domain
VVAPVKILVVDDEEQIAQLLSGLLKSEGHQAEYVTDGEAALDRLTGGEFDLLVTDLRMPRMTGMQLIEKARDVAPDTDALIMTAYASTETAVDALRRGVSDYLSKPFGVDEVKAAVDKCLASREQRRKDEQKVNDLSAKVVSTEQSLEQRVGDLSFLHELTRLIADRSTPLKICLGAIRSHFDADAVILTQDNQVMERCGEEGDHAEELLRVGRRTALAGLARFGAQDQRYIAAPLEDGAVVAGRSEPFCADDLRLLSITARDLGLAVENDRLRATQRSAYIGIVSTLIEAVEAKDRFNRGHSRRVADLAARFAHHVGLSGRECELVATAAKLHDIGKIGIPEEILNKAGKLTSDEFDVIKSHPVIGEQILMPLDFLAETRPIVRHHHEHWDGSGYPDGLSGHNIPRNAALLSIVDAFDAMTSNRPYREGMPHEKALDILEDGAGSQWDPELVDRFATL